MYDFWFECLKKCITVSKIIKICLTYGMVFVPLFVYIYLAQKPDIYRYIWPRNQTYTVVSAPAVTGPIFMKKSDYSRDSVYNSKEIP